LTLRYLVSYLDTTFSYLLCLLTHEFENTRISFGQFQDTYFALRERICIEISHSRFVMQKKKNEKFKYRFKTCSGGRHAHLRAASCMVSGCRHEATQGRLQQKGVIHNGASSFNKQVLSGCSDRLSNQADIQLHSCSQCNCTQKNSHVLSSHIIGLLSTIARSVCCVRSVITNGNI